MRLIDEDNYLVNIKKLWNITKRISFKHGGALSVAQFYLQSTCLKII